MSDEPLRTEPKNEGVQLSPPWSRTTKTTIAIIGVLLLSLVAYRFQAIIGQVVTAGVLAYVLNPLIKLGEERTPLTRGTMTLVVYFTLLLLVIGAFTAVGVAAYGQTLNLIDQLPGFINNTVALVRTWAEQPEVALGPFRFSLAPLDWSSIRQQLLGMVEPLISRSGQYVGQVASSTVRFLGNLLFLWIISIYISLEIPRLGEYVGRAAQMPGYRRDAERLMAEFGSIWSAYLRGQIILGLVIGIIVGTTLGLLGVQNALALGLLSGFLEFIPVLGPFIGTGAAMLVAFFQPANYLGFTPIQYALLILAVMFLIQQLENNILVPRIVGDALDLHPLLVIIGVLMGSSMAGILGAILAAPILATLKLLGIYAWRKLFDLPPFPADDEMFDGERASWRERLRDWWYERMIVSGGNVPGGRLGGGGAQARDTQSSDGPVTALGEDNSRAEIELSPADSDTP